MERTTGKGFSFLIVKNEVEFPKLGCDLTGQKERLRSHRRIERKADGNARSTDRQAAWQVELLRSLIFVKFAKSL
jgi:hypothetical protein